MHGVNKIVKVAESEFLDRELGVPIQPTLENTRPSPEQKTEKEETKDNNGLGEAFGGDDLGF